MKKSNADNFIKFLGTSGARFVMIRQLRSSGGMWICCEGTNVLIDPGPGSLVRCAGSRPVLNPTQLDGIILTHRHLDHAGDITVMIEAMTEGGFKKRGIVFCPQDAVGDDPVIQRYAMHFPERIEILRPFQQYRVGNLAFSTSGEHKHSVQTYGLKFALHKTRIALLSDTRFFSGLQDFYRVDVLIVNVVFFEPRAGIDHLSLLDVEQLIPLVNPHKVILTHFGMSMLQSKPHLQAKSMTQTTGVEVVAAYDGMCLRF